MLAIALCNVIIKTNDNKLIFLILWDWHFALSQVVLYTPLLGAIKGEKPFSAPSHKPDLNGKCPSCFQVLFILKF